MLEAVNSTLANAPFVRQSAEQVSSAASNAARRSVARGPEAPYISPYVVVDNNFDKAVIQIRDSNTGDVVDQFPSEEALERQRAENERQRLEQAQADIVRRAEAQQEQVAQAQNTEIRVSNTGFEAQRIASDVQVSVPTQSAPAASPSVPAQSFDTASAAITAASQSGSAPSTATQVSFDA